MSANAEQPAAPAAHVSLEDVRHIAHLSRLHLTDQELGSFARELARILEYVAQLQEVDVADVPPTAHAGEIANVFRPDEPGLSLSIDAALRNAPERRGSFFQVPKVLDHDL